jgi:hypothetical protein
MEPVPESKDNMVFNPFTIRMFIGVIALALPWVVSWRAAEILDSISWSYYAPVHIPTARDFFVGALFVIGAFLMSYKGYKYILTEDRVGPFWQALNRFWPGAIKFRIWQRECEEDQVSWLGGLAAWATALFPTSECIKCAGDSISKLHFTAAAILFLTTVYFCLVAFKIRVVSKINARLLAPMPTGTDPQKLRLLLYEISGWGILLSIVTYFVLEKIVQVDLEHLTFGVESVALTLFGVAWLVASRPTFLSILNDPTEAR